MKLPQTSFLRDLFPRFISPSAATVLPSSPRLLLPGWKEPVPVVFALHRRARKYIVKVTARGEVRLTIPRSGSRRFALSFAQKQAPWLVEQLTKNQKRQTAWTIGHSFLFQGESVPIRIETEENRSFICWAATRMPQPKEEEEADLRPQIAKALRAMAVDFLTPRTTEWASRLQLYPNRIVIRDQHSLWGSCSSRRTISLNWRLIQAPPWVADYIIVHELIHLAEMNHSARFWHRVATAYPRWNEAEQWLKTHRIDLL